MKTAVNIDEHDKFLFNSDRVVNIDEHENQDNLERIRNHGKNNFLLNLISETDINIGPSIKSEVIKINLIETS
jgi:hypothetical protein